jgi:hypothetical protein
LLLPDEETFVVDDIHEGVDVGVFKATQEIAGGGGIGDALGPKEVEIGFVVAEEFEVVDGGAAGEEVVGEVEDVVGFKVGDMAFEEMEVGVEGVGEFEALDKEEEDAEASGVEAFGFVGDVVVNVLVFEHGAGLNGPLFFAEAALEAALAIAEATL